MSLRTAQSYGNSYLTSRDHIIQSFRDSLDPLLFRLREESSANATSPRSTGSESSIGPLTIQELDSTVEAFLAFVGAKFCLWIFQDFMDSADLQAGIWNSFFFPVVNQYRADVTSSYQNAYTATGLATRRFEKICKHVSYFYKLFIARVIEYYGCTPQLHYVVSVLHLLPPVPRSVSPLSPPERVDLMLHQTVHDCLCHMGDLSRYRTASIPSSSDPDYTHAIIYYRTAFRIQATSGTPLNQLGNISYATGDIFSGAYYFLQSVSVADPFRDGNSNLRTILRKLLKIKQSSLAKLRIAGILEVSDPGKLPSGDSDDGNDLAVIEEDEDGKQDTRQSKKSVTEAKQALMRILQLYATYYISHVPAAKPGLKYDVQLSENVQIEFATKIGELTAAKLINGRVVVKLAIIGIVFVYLLEQSKSKNPNSDDLKALLDPVEAYQAILSLHLRVFDSLLNVALSAADRDECGILASNRRVKPVIAALLPAFRVYFDWLRKQTSQKKINGVTRGFSGANDLYSKATRFLEYIREAYGFKFDVVTAVSRTPWDRFDDIMKHQEESTPISGNITGNDTDEGSSIWREAETKKKQKQRLLYENDEETQCSGLLAFCGGLHDIPSGLGTVSRKQRSAQEIYRAQCLLFTGVEISRLSPSFLEFDEFAGDLATFDFVGIKLTPWRKSNEPTGSGLVPSASDEGQLDEMFDETELYDLIGRGTIPSQSEMETDSNARSDGSDNGSEACEQQLDIPEGFTGKPQSLMTPPGSDIKSVNDLETLEVSQSTSTLEPLIGGQTQPQRSVNTSTSLEETNTDRSSRKTKSPPLNQVTQDTESSEDGEDSQDSEDSEEEIVFLGRGRTTKD